jgi:hypothetical protein
MSLLPRKGLLAIAAVIDVALNAVRTSCLGAQASRRATICRRAISSRYCRRWCTRASSTGSAVRAADMNWRANGGGISVADVLRAAGNDENEQGQKSARILDEIVLPALADAERAFTAALAQLSIEDLARRAENLRDR